MYYLGSGELLLLPVIIGACDILKWEHSEQHHFTPDVPEPAQFAY